MHRHVYTSKVLADYYSVTKSLGGFYWVRQDSIKSRLKNLCCLQKVVILLLRGRFTFKHFRKIPNKHTVFYDIGLRMLRGDSWHSELTTCTSGWLKIGWIFRKTYNVHHICKEMLTVASAPSIYFHMPARWGQPPFSEPNLQCWSKETQLWSKNFSCPPPWRRGLNFEHSQPPSKLIYLFQGAHKKFMDQSCVSFDQHCMCWGNETLEKELGQCKVLDY